MRKKFEDDKDFKTNKTNNNKPNGRPKPRRNRRGGNGDKDKPENSTNDPAWYSASPELLRDAASIPFSWPVGTTMGNKDKLDPDVSFGVAALELTPTIGYSQTEQSAVNVAANAIYSFVRHANSGHSNYDAPDLMMYLLAMSNIYSFITWCQRLLGSVSIFDQRNRFIPQALFDANDVSYVNLRDNISNFRYWLNTFITKVSSLVVPDAMNIFKRLAFLYANYYIDGPSIKDQLYMFVPYQTAWYKFGLNSQTGAGELTLTSMTGHNHTVQDIIDYGEDLFAAIWEQEDFGIMSGDILKAYAGNIIHLATVPSEFTIAPIYDAMVLHQFKNAKLATYFIPTPISQQTNGLILHKFYGDQTIPEAPMGTQRTIALMHQVLTTDFEQPGPDVVIESTRFMFGWNSADDTIYTGTEVARAISAYTYNNDGSLNKATYVVDTGVAPDVVDASRMRTLSNIAWTAKSFKYFPEMFVGVGASNGTWTTAHKIRRVWDIDNYAVLDLHDLEKMHDAALMSLFAVPAIAKIS